MPSKLFFDYFSILYNILSLSYVQTLSYSPSVSLTISVTRFGKISLLLQILNIFGKILMVYFLFGKMQSLLWPICYSIGLIFIVANDQILKNNPTTWSHCLPFTIYTLLSCGHNQPNPKQVWHTPFSLKISLSFSLRRTLSRDGQSLTLSHVQRDRIWQKFAT